MTDLTVAVVGATGQVGRVMRTSWKSVISPALRFVSSPPNAPQARYSNSVAKTLW